MIKNKQLIKFKVFLKELLLELSLLKIFKSNI